MSQRDLARKAKTSQSVVARIELGQTSPTYETLARLIECAGFDLRATLVPHPTVHPQMLDDVPRILALTPEERLIELRNISRFLRAAHRV